MFPSPETFPVSKYVVIGSRALRNRRANDIDIICRPEDLPNDALRHEKLPLARFVHCGIDAECYLTGGPLTFLDEIYQKDLPYGKATFEHLFWLKDSHIHRPQGNRLKWEKHIHDWHFLFESLSHEEWKRAMDLRNKHRRMTDEYLGPITSPRLIGVSKREFFDDNVTKKYDHDDLHRAVAYTPGSPLYERMQRPESEVECDRGLWRKFSYEDKCRTVREECYVIALERFLIPGKERYSVQSAFLEALYKTCTTLTSGWFRDFAIEEYFDIYNGAALKPGFSYYDRFLANGPEYVRGFAE